MNRQNLLISLLFFFFLFTKSGHAQISDQPVIIRLPSLVAAPGDTLYVPVNVTDLTGHNVLSSNLTITYNAHVLTATQVIIQETLTQNWFVAQNLTIQDSIGTVNIALSSVTKPALGAGTLITIEFLVSTKAQNDQQAHLYFDRAILNNRTPQTQTQDGSVLIKRPLIGDFNNDTLTDFSDFILFAQHFGLNSQAPNFVSIYDLNHDGHIGFTDFILFASSFGASFKT